jgi:hypothetical protein
MVSVAESFAQEEEMLKAQTTYQMPHVTMVRATKSSTQAKERL